MKRSSALRPGYDCVRAPCGRGQCGRTGGGNHGIHNDEWIFSVTDDAGELALSLHVSSGNFPETVPRELVARYASQKPSAHLLSLHVGYWTTREQVRSDARGQPCELLGSCFDGGCWGLAAREFNPLLVGATFITQKEELWTALEARLCELAKSEPRVDDYERCTHCDATGTVKKSVTS